MSLSVSTQVGNSITAVKNNPKASVAYGLAAALAVASVVLGVLAAVHMGPLSHVGAFGALNPMQSALVTAGLGAVVGLAIMGVTRFTQKVYPIYSLLGEAISPSK